MQQQPLASVEESEAEEIVVDERRQRAQHDVDHAESDFPSRHDHLCAQGRVAVHMVDVVRERRVGMVHKRASELSRYSLGQPDIFMHHSIFEYCLSSTKQPNLSIHPKASIPNPPTEKEILS